MMNLLRRLFGIFFQRPKYLSLWLVPAFLCAPISSSKAQGENSDTPVSHWEERPPGAAGTEASWIVQSVTGEIVRLSAYAAKLDSSAFPPNLTTVETLPSDAAGFHYTVEVHLPKQDVFRAAIDIPGSIWDPQAYGAFTGDIFARLHLDKQKQLGSIGGNPLASLTDPRVEVIQQENKRVSQWLTAHPLDAAAHEQAALVLGTLGMRENAGSFFDPRVLCNRATAQLALARTLRAGQPQSDCGDVGELLVGLLIDRKADCEKRIDALASRIGSAPELKPWSVAARLRNRRDYRIMPDPAQGTLLERIELFRAMNEAAGTAAACKALDASLHEPLADWTRILLQFQFSVDQGHQFTRAALPYELAEAGKIFPELLKGTPTPEGFAKALNREPGHIVNSNAEGAPVVEVIDASAWAMFLQRHLCHTLSRTYHFLNDLLGAADAAREFRASISAQFQKLTLYPLVSVDAWDTAWDMTWIGSESPAILNLLRTHPELVSDGLWGRIPLSQGNRQASGTMAMQEWFAPGLPPGTAYCFWTRSRYLPDVRGMTEAEARRCYHIAPWHYGVAEKFLKTRAETPSAAQFKEVLGRYLDYYQPAMRGYAALVKDDPAEYIAITRRLALDNPGYYLELGKYFAAHRKEKEAVEAYENAFTHQADAVQLSNECEWLVDYYADHGRNDRAIQIAKFAADVYSATGLAIMARLMERLGQPEDAEEYYLKIQERYGDRSHLPGLYYRQRVKDPNSALAGKYGEMEKKVFPEKARSVVVSDFTGPPQHGVLIPVSNEVVAAAGLKPSDVIVAIDKKQVDNIEQYTFIRELSDSDEMDFIVYRDGEYQTVHATVPGRRFEIPFETYHP